MHSKITPLLLILLFTNLFKVFAQDIKPPQVIPPGPEAQTFMRYGEIPVDHSTGIPSIKIPLYSIVSGKLSLPIELTYHASGIKVNDIAGVAGLGWRLSAGGVLTKGVVGKSDNDASYGMLNYPYPTKSQIDAFPQNGSQWLALNRIAKGIMDGESDKYYYSVGDKLSGQFIYSNAGNIIPTSFSDNKVVSISPTSYKIISNDGTQYYFNYTESSKLDNDLPYISSWWLNKIVSADNLDEITFEYQTDNVNDPDILYMYSQSLTLDNSPALAVLYSSSQMTTVPTLLKRINFKNGYLSFSYANDRKDMKKQRLTSINVYSTSSNTPLIKWQFDHSYFNSGTADDKYNYRLKLDQLWKFDSSFQNPQKYSFEYFSNDGFMPPYGKLNHYMNNPSVYGQDYFGYYNGVNTNEHLITAALSIPYYKPADRNPNFQYAKMCTLNKINYPTGGSTSFEYELNDGSPISGQLGSGLRIKRVISISDQIHTAKIKRYNYRNNNLVLDFDNFGSRYYEINPIVFDSWCGYVTPTWPVYSSELTLPFATYNGGHVVYGDVEEYAEGPGGNLRTDYHYDLENDQIITVDAPRYSNQYYIESTWNKGILSGIIDYRYDPVLGYQIAKTQSFEYTDYRVQQVIAGTKIIRKNPIINRGCNSYNLDTYVSPYTYQQYFNYFDVPISIGVKKQTKISSTERDGAGGVVTTVENIEYNSPDHLFPTSRKILSSDGQAKLINYTYPSDYPGTAVCDAMVGRNIISPIIEQAEYKNTSANFLKGTRTNYGFWSSGTNVGVATSQIYPVTIETRKGPSGDYEPRVQYDGYDEKGNVLAVRKAGGPSVSYIWGYDKAYPIAEVKGAPVNEVYHVNFEETTDYPTPGVVKDGSMYHTGRYSGKISNSGSGEVTYHSNTWLQVQLNGEKKFRYSGWVYSDGPSAELFLFMKQTGETGYYTKVHSVGTSVTGSWVFVQGETDVPANITSLNLRLDNNGAANGGQNVWFDDLRIYPVDAQMSTYTYDPLVGMTSSSDAKDMATYYEYDAFGRLGMVKDKDRNILKSFCYNYLGQQADCFTGQAQTVYARISSGTTNYQTSGSYGDQTTYGYTSMTIQFYSDAACTIPVTLSTGMTVSVARNWDWYDEFGSGSSGDVADHQVPAGVSSYPLGSMLTSEERQYLTGYGEWIYSSTLYYFNMTSHTGSNYTPL